MPIKDLRDKKCLLTGAASGIGEATALLAASKGAEVFLTDINAEGLADTARRIEAAGGKVGVAKAIDVADHDAVKTLGDEIHAAHGSMDVVMNIAGISTWGTVQNLEHEHWRQLVEINLMGPIHVIETFIPPMAAAGRGGHLVNVSSAAGLFGLPWHAAYSATKFGVRGISEVLRFDLREHGIGVSLVCPGAVKTPLVGTVQIVGVDREDPRVQKMVGRFERRAVRPEQVAEAIVAGVEKNRYMVYSSPDIRFGHFVQRKFELPYAIAMRALNSRISALAKKL